MNLAARFGLTSSTPRRRLAPTEALDLVPVRAPHVEASEAGDELILSVRRRNSGLARILSWFFTLPERKTFQLDRIGTMVWRLCDGATSVGAIADRLGNDFGWPPDEARKAVLQFLAYLSERKLVGFPAAGGSAQPA